MNNVSDVVGPISARLDGRMAEPPLEAYNLKAREYFRLKDAHASARQILTGVEKEVSALEERLSWAKRQEAEACDKALIIRDDETKSEEERYHADLTYKYAYEYCKTVSGYLSEAEFRLQKARSDVESARSAEEAFVMSLLA